jgi:23S rRNA (cytosine1962-C5)-methyltransferase
MLELTLKQGRERSVLRRHPWVLSGAVDKVRGEEALGAWTRVCAADGRTLGFGHFSPASTLRVRLVSFGESEPPADWLVARIAESIARRRDHPFLRDTDAVRLINAEGDGLPGLTVDRFAEIVVVRITSAGMDRCRGEIAEAVREHSGALVGYERADGHAARREGLAQHEGVLWGEAPMAPVQIDERGRRFEVDVVRGQKTGFYLDQRDARDLVQQLSQGRRVLDLFSYTGGFGVAAARGGAAEVMMVDSSKDALAAAERHVRANAPDCPVELHQGDAFEYMRAAAREPGRFDLLVVDPPPLARHKAAAERAGRAYKDVLLHAFRAAAPGAFVFGFSCSYHVGPDLFRKVAFGAAVDAGKDVQVLRTLGAPVDHPVSIHHPEGQYLSGLLMQV